MTTDWTTLNDPAWKNGRIAYLRLSKQDGIIVMSLKATTAGNVVSVKEGADFLIKTESGEVVKFKNHEFEIAGYGDGAINLRGSKALGVELHFLATQEQVEIISKSKIAKVRLVTSEGNLEIEPETKKYKKGLQELFKTFATFSAKY